MSHLQQVEAELKQTFSDLKNKSLNLDLTRGKPCAEQLDLSNTLDGILANNYIFQGTDTRNYGGLDGFSELKSLFAAMFKSPAESVLIGGNSSLSLMHQTLMFAHFLGLFDTHKPWSQQLSNIKFICPVPGYDRHFSICESLNIEMINVPMREDGPDMDLVETLVNADSSIKGMWNVPRFSNPTGITYSDATVKRIAALPSMSASDFVVMWDNAYALHSFTTTATELSSISTQAAQFGTENNIIEFASTSKISFAGSGIAAMCTGAKTLARFKALLASSTIGPDKINQLRHLKLFNNFSALQKHMTAHAALIKPRFDAALNALEVQLDASMGRWTRPEGGYFISFDAPPGTAQNIIDLCAEAGVKMTPAGATFPYGKDPEDSNIRIAPSYASLEDIKTAMDVFVVCVKLAQVRQRLAS